MRLFILLTVLFFSIANNFAAETEPPTDWIDPDTGHRIIRLSQEPGSESLYFHQNAFTARGDKLVITTPHGISTVDLKTHDIDLVVPDSRFETNQSGMVIGKRTRQVFYIKRTESNTVAFATDLDTHATRRVGIVPGTGRGSMLAINADETLLAGSFVETLSEREKSTAAYRALAKQPSESKGAWMQKRVQAKVPMQLFTLDVKTGKARTFHKSTDWLNHVQMSPTDPSLILFCHEGPWHLVDRTWLIRSNGRGLTKVHPRTMQMEIAGHEFFSADGKTVWYDLQTPRGEDFWLAGYEVETGARIWYHLQRDEWSVHYNVSPDGKLFAGDGGHEGSVAKARDGKWIYLFRPELVRAANGPQPEFKNLITPGVFHSERLVNMKNHDYKLEPNVNFTPDGKWIVFRSNMFGAPQVFAVEVAKANP